MRHDLEVLPDRSGLVDDVGERVDLEFIDELGDRLEIVASSNADEGDIGAVSFLYLCDRRGFTTTRWSPRRPEPQQHILATQRVEVELGTAGGWHHHRFEVCGRRNYTVDRCRLDSRDWSGGRVTARTARSDRQSGRSDERDDAARTQRRKLSRNSLGGASNQHTTQRSI
ncbi:hypothetical protein [Ilumatobacter sp.]|uniref:hypothetical protein n=1 Tax=Ilumatobacter sp. TaxID=1967498 RepID=UPI003AF42B0F